MNCGLEKILKRMNSDLKRYCILCTYFATRAVHIEVTNALETESFYTDFNNIHGKTRSC